jgi:lysophospholipase L1-like esterase
LYNELPKSSLAKKTINALGDSITSIDYTLPNWWQIIGDRTFAQFNNYGKSGSRIAVSTERTDSFIERLNKLDTTADGVIVMGGTNDSYTPLGTWDSDDTTTFYGALNVMIKALIGNFAGKPIIFCTPIQTAISYSSNAFDPKTLLSNKGQTDNTSLQQKAEAIKAKCDQYGIPCIDLYNSSGINGADTNKIYYRSNDNLHPSYVGMQRMANIIQTELEKHFDPVQ